MINDIIARHKPPEISQEQNQQPKEIISAVPPATSPGPCLICGCPSLWSDRYTGQLHCESCEPPPGQSLISRRYFVLVTRTGKQALLEVDRETLQPDPSDYERIYSEKQTVGSKPTMADSGQWATWTESDGTVVVVAASELREHQTGRAGPKPGKSFEEWWKAGSEKKLVDEVERNFRSATIHDRASSGLVPKTENHSGVRR